MTEELHPELDFTTGDPKEAEAKKSKKRKTIVIIIAVILALFTLCCGVIFLIPEAPGDSAASAEPGAVTQEDIPPAASTIENNPRITNVTSCIALEELHASGDDCGINDEGIKGLIHLKKLYTDGNSRITTKI